MSELELINVLSASEKAIGTLMLEVNRLSNEIILKDEQIEQLKALVISMSHRNANLQYTKASEKITCIKCNGTGGVCEWHPDKEAHKCCGGAGMPCECTKESE
jgi:hypothetical protein